MKTVAISQPMYFPWLGLFEQLHLADEFIFFDNVQYARGFINRVQYKTASGTSWLTVPLCKHGRNTLILDLQSAEKNEWRKKHLRALSISLSGAPYAKDAIELSESVLLRSELSFSDMLIESILAIGSYFDLLEGKVFHRSSNLPIAGYKSDLVQNLVTHLDGDRYITGLGAMDYLDHSAFESTGIDVCYMNYQKKEYPQKFYPFTPYVTALDLVANCGPSGRDFINSGVISWQEALTKYKD